ncbi:MAG: DUF1080 domain-containing protein [Pirellulaceae bacterium]|nr:DUF1080 domain-containing protein [Pirellulaceae bacterium]
MKSAAFAVCVALALITVAADETTPKDSEKFVSLFNGRDLAGWVSVNVAPGTFSVKDGLIVSTGKPTGTMRTEKMYENFILELEWRHMVAGGNAGVFIWGDPLTAVGTPFSRGIEVQVLDGRNSESYTSHGDVFSIWGAKMKPDRPHPNGSERCLPSERRAKPSPEWNHYRVTCQDGVLKLAVNGKEVSGGSGCKPRKGYICLESEGSECHFRNLKICELPTTNPQPEEVATEYQGFTTMYNGLDLAGWKTDPANKGHWQAKDWVLAHDGQGEAKEKKDNHLWTEKSYRNFEIVVDWRLDSKRITKKKWPIVRPSGDDALDGDGKVKEMEVDDAGNSGILLRGNEDAQINICCRPVGSGEITAFRVNKALPMEIRAGCTPKKRVDAKIGTWNRFIITVNGEQVSVLLNGEKIIDSVRLPGMPQDGSIGLQQHGEPLEFANLFIRELP